jgi:hypothetical protein
MSANLTLAVVPAAIGTLVGGTIAFLLFRKIVAQRYQDARRTSRHASLKYWCGALSFLAIARGLIGVLNELIFSFTNSIPVNQDNIFRSVIGALGFSAFFYFSQFCLTAILSEKISLPENNQAPREGSTPRPGTKRTALDSIVEKTGFSKNISIALGFFLCAIVIALPWTDFLAKEQKFEVVECEHCGNSGGSLACKKTQGGIIFVVSDSKVVYKSVDKDGRITVTEQPSGDTKCIFNTSGRFSFACSSYSVSDGYKRENYSDFDGTKIMKSGFRDFFWMGGDFRPFTDSKSTCEVRR